MSLFVACVMLITFYAGGMVPSISSSRNSKGNSGYETASIGYTSQSRDAKIGSRAR